MPKIRRPRLSASTLAAGYVLFGVAALAAFAAPLWFAWQITISDGRAEILREDADRLASVFEAQGADGLQTFIDARVDLHIAHERMLLFTDAMHHRLAGNLPYWPGGIPASAGTEVTSVDVDGRRLRAVFVHLPLPQGYHLLVGRDLSKFEPLETHFWYGLSGAVAILIVVGLIGAGLIRRELLSRIDAIRATVAAIMHGELSHRLPARDGRDELDTLSQTINGLLDQIEQLVHGIADVSNSIAHDLRTPLTELRARLEELLVTRPPAEVLFNGIEASVADVDRVIAIFNALLRLAEIDAGTRRGGFSKVDVARLVGEIVDFYQPAAEVRDIALDLKADILLEVPGDPWLLMQAVGNLLDNAIKYTPAGGRIVVTCARADDAKVSVCVADNGPGIPDSERPRAAERFFRGDASRGSPGIGLGLSIVDAVARLHGGALRLGDNAPGLCAVMTLGSSAPADPDAARLDTQAGVASSP